MATYRDIIDSYTALVASGAADTDLTPEQRALVARLLRVVARPPILTDRETVALSAEHPPTDLNRAAAISTLYLYVGRTYAVPADYGLDMAGWDAAVMRTAAILRAV